MQITFCENLRIRSTSEGRVFWTVDVVGLYPNSSHDEGLTFLKDFLDSKVDSQVTGKTFIELAEFLIIFMAALKEKILSKVRKRRDNSLHC